MKAAMCGSNRSAAGDATATASNAGASSLTFAIQLPASNGLAQGISGLSV